MRNLLIIIISIFLIQNSFAQSCSNQRYQAPIFDEVNVYEDITYATAKPFQTYKIIGEYDYKFDFYEPMDDTVGNRPLVIMLCGGDFNEGDKSNSEVKTWCDSLASYGYTCAAVNYRQGYNTRVKKSVERAIYRSVQDARAAIRYFKEFQYTFKIDTSKIFLGGDKAGAITALHTAFMADDSQRPQSSYGFKAENSDLGCLDCSGNPFKQSTNIAGVINIRGKITSLDLIKAQNEIPVIHVEDEIAANIPQKSPLDILKMPNTSSIHSEMDRLGMNSEKETAAIFNASMVSTISQSQELWNAVWKNIHGFLFEKMTYKSPQPNGEPVACAGRPTMYKIESMPNGSFCWQVQGGEIIGKRGNTITVLWDYDADKGYVQVTSTNEANITGSVSEPLIVELKEPPVAEFSVDQISDNMIELTDESSYGTFYTIDFGDDSSPVSGQIGGKVVHIYDYPGQFLITQALENTCGTTNNNYQINVKKIETDSWELLKSNIAIQPEIPTLGETINIEVLEGMPYEIVRIKILDEENEEILYQRIRGKESRDFDIEGHLLKKGKYTIRIMAGSNTVNKYFEVK